MWENSFWKLHLTEIRLPRGYSKAVEMNTYSEAPVILGSQRITDPQPAALACKDVQWVREMLQLHRQCPLPVVLSRNQLHTLAGEGPDIRR